MQNGSERQTGEEAPLYVRWSPERSPYAIELRLDLVAEIQNELARAEKLGIEVGGVLVGAFPTSDSPVLRIEEVEVVARGVEEGAIYVLNPGQHDRFADIRLRARARHRDAVGFFRSHLRPGVMRLSLADRTQLSGEFRESLYAVLLIEGRDPHTATFFLAANGRLPGEPSVRDFRFDEREFRALPEVQPEPAALPTTERMAPRRKRRAHGKLYGIVAALLLIAVAACALMWFFYRQAPPPHSLEASNALKLAVTDRRAVLGITWDHAAPALDRASGATVVIVDGAGRSELQLGVDELRLGAIEYERSGPLVQVTMTVKVPGSEPLSQTILWGQPKGQSIGQPATF